MAAPTYELPPRIGPEADHSSGEQSAEELPPSTYVLEELNLGPRVRHYIVNPETLEGYRELGETDSESRRVFQEAVDNPYKVDFMEGEYATCYDACILNGERASSSKNPLVYSPGMTCGLAQRQKRKSPHNRKLKPPQNQAREALWQLSQRFPDRPIIAIGNEGTYDVATTGIASEQSPETTPYATLNVLEEMLEELDVWPNEIDLVGESNGSVTSFEVAKYLEELHPDLEVGNLVLVESPVGTKGVAELAREIVPQDVRKAIFDSPWEGKARLVGHFATSVIPRVINSSGVANTKTYARQARHAAGTPVDAEHLPEGPRTILIGAEEDKTAQFYDFFTSPEGSPQTTNEIVGITIEGKEYSHSSLILDPELVGKMVEMAINLPRDQRPKQAA